jgi:hypothetical protein
VPGGFIFKKLGWNVILPREISAESGSFVPEGKEERTWDVETGTSFGMRHANGDGGAIRPEPLIWPWVFDSSPDVAAPGTDKSGGPRGEVVGFALSHDSISDKI